MTTKNALTVRKPRIKYCPIWHVLADDGTVIWALSEAQISTKSVFVSPDAGYKNQTRVALEMEVGETCYARIMTPNYSVQDKTHVIARIIRVS